MATCQWPQQHSALNMDPDEEDRKVGWGRRVHARFATPASRNILGHSNTPLSLENTFIGRTLGKSSYLEPIPGSSREPSVASTRDAFPKGLITPTPAGGPGPAQKAARHSVEGNGEDAASFSLEMTPDMDSRFLRSRDAATQPCHCCGEALHFEQHCAVCGHDFCYKCALERLKRSANVWPDTSRQTPMTQQQVESPATCIGSASVTPIVSATATPETPTRGPVTGNPFFLADQCSRGTSSAPPKATRNPFARRPRRLSDCVPRRSMARTVATQKPKIHQGCGEDDHVHDVEGHSLCCSAQMKSISINGNAENDDLTIAAQNEVGRLRCHAEEFHKSQNTLGHNNPRFQPCSRRRDSSTRVSVNTVADETPTRLPRRPRLPSLDVDDDERRRTERGRLVRDIKQDGTAKGAGPSLSHYMAPHGHCRRDSQPVSMATSSSSVKETKRTADTGEPRDRESALRPQPLTLKSKKPDAVGSIGIDKAQPASGRKSPMGEDVIDFVPHSMPVMGHDKVVPELSRDPFPGVRRTGHDLPGFAGYKQHRWDTHVCSRPQTPHPGPEPWPSLRKVESPRRDGQQPSTQPSISWSRQSLRRVSSSGGCLHVPSEMVDSPISPRNKGDGRQQGEDRAKFGSFKMIPETTPMSDWRRNLVTRQEGNALDPRRMSIPCESCNQTDLRRPASGNEASEGCSHGSNSLTPVKDSDSNLEDPFTEPKLSIRAIENGLAWKKAQDDLEKDADNDEAKVPKSPRTSLTSTASWTKSAGERDTAGCSQPCRWRRRYLKLLDEMLESEDLSALCEEGCEWKENDAHYHYDGSAADELGIEALTVVVHMRQRDDLVINTDLTGRQKGGD